MIRKNTFLSLLLIGGFFVSCKNSAEKEQEIVTAAPIEFKKEGELFLIASEGDTIRQLDIEIADNEYERETGLMYRTEMEDDQGMLFVFPEEQPRGFYMKNTYIPLDLIFLDSKKEIVSITRNAEPGDLATIPSGAPAQYVLEVKAGLADQWDLKVGDKIAINE